MVLLVIYTNISNFFSIDKGLNCYLGFWVNQFEIRRPNYTILDFTTKHILNYIITFNLDMNALSGILSKINSSILNMNIKTKASAKSMITILNCFDFETVVDIYLKFWKDRIVSSSPAFDILDSFTDAICRGLPNSNPVVFEKIRNSLPVVIKNERCKSVVESVKELMLKLAK